MINYIVAGVVSALSVFFCGFYLRYEQLRSQKNIKALIPTNSKQLLFGICVFLSIAILYYFLNFYYDYLWLASVKRIVFCASLWPVAFVDNRSRIIPNKILLFLIVIRAIFAVFELIFDFSSGKKEIANSFIACIGITVVFCLMRMLVKNGMGFGDIKLFAVSGLYFGIVSSITVVFLSFIVSFIEALYLLFIKKKGKKDSFAFGPAILIGSFMAMILFEA